MTKAQVMKRLREKFGRRAHAEHRPGRKPHGMTHTVGQIVEPIPGMPMFLVFGMGNNWKEAWDNGVAKGVK